MTVEQIVTAITAIPDARVQRCLWRSLIRATIARQAAEQGHRGTAYLHRLRVCYQLMRVQAPTVYPRAGSRTLVPIDHDCAAQADPVAWAIRQIM